MHCVVSSAKGNSTRTDAWADEIRQYLLGRISKTQIVHALVLPRASDFTLAPVRRWWMFEGKAYDPLGGTLRKHWDWVVENSWRLLRQFNPRIRLSDRIEADVDWAQTLSRGVGQIRREYVLRSSGIGLDNDELNTLRCWAKWIDDEWSAYARHVGMEESVNWRNFAQETGTAFTIEQLRRWAYIAKRSRWPLLRVVVAESLRPMLEVEELDRIPLPSDDATLFELLCLVRLARYLAPPHQCNSDGCPPNRITESNWVD